VSRNEYPSLTREEQQELLRELAYVGCARSGQLRFASSKKTTEEGPDLGFAVCSVCDDPTSRPESNELVSEDDIFLEVKSTLEAIATVPEFKTSNSARIMYSMTVFRFLQHAPREFLNIKEPFGQWCLRSLRSSSRELRIAAGKTLTVFSDDCVPEDLRKQNRLTTLDFLRQLSEVGDVGSQETTILALRRIARVCREDELNIVLLLLVEFLGNTNPVISGVAYTELKSLAEDFDQKPDDMFRPFWRTTAIAVVKDFISCPQKIQQLCDLIGRSVKQFLSMTLVDTLPYLIWTKNTAILNRIAERSGTSVGQLCSGSGKNLAAILSFLLLRTPSNPERNVMELLGNAAPEFSQYDLSGWVKFQPVMIACEMLKSAADEDPRKRPDAHQAIEVLANLAERKSGRSSMRGAKARASFFSEYVLGIMAHFSDVIDAIRGDQLLSERKRCLRAIQELVVMADQEISVALPQVRACLQSALDVPGLRDEAFSAWSTLISNLRDEDMEAMLHHTFAVITQNYENLSSSSQNLAFETISKLIKDHPDLIRHHVDTLPSLASIPLMSKLEKALKSIRLDLDVPSALEAFTQRFEDENAAVVIQCLQELLPFLESNQSFVHEAAIAQPPPPIISSLCRSILDASVRFAEGNQDIGILCSQALGMIGCLDPYRVESVREKKDVLVLENFESFEEVVKFVVFLLETVIVKAFHSATNARAQGFLAYAMQELLAFCNFRQLASYRPRSSQVDNSEYRRWIKIPEHIRSTLTPFLSSHYNIQRKATGPPEQNAYPIFSPAISYATWLRTFVLDLLHRGKGDNAKMMFSILARIIQGHDLSIPSTLLPIAVLNVVIGGTDSDAKDIREEFLKVLQFPLQDQEPTVADTIKQCSENVLRVLDYLMRWHQKKRKLMLDSQAVARKTGRKVAEHDEERDAAQISAMDQVLFAIPAEVISRRAVDCGSYAQALFHWESHIRQRKEREGGVMESEEHNQLYQHLQDIYAEIDEPDEIEGVSAHLQVLDPEQQILEHKKAGRWTAVQTWYEQELTKNPSDPGLQASLLASLKEAGQYGK
jgi:serine/threonine-protein kinase ATR